jgi:hypothetical protein
MTYHKGNSLSPEPCALIPTGLKVSSMTSGSRPPRPTGEHPRTVSASVMDGGKAGMRGAW